MPTGDLALFVEFADFEWDALPDTPNLQAAKGMCYWHFCAPTHEVEFGLLHITFASVECFEVRRFIPDSADSAASSWPNAYLDVDGNDVSIGHKRSHVKRKEQ